MASDAQSFIERFFKDFSAGEKVKTLMKYSQLNKLAIKGQIVLVGSSLMEWFPIDELKQSLGIPNIIYNRGIGSFTTSELLGVLDTCVFELEPSKIFINIGSNDMAESGFTVDGLRQNYREIISQIKTRLPACRIFMMAYYPINDLADFGDEFAKTLFANRNNETIRTCNGVVEALAAEMGCDFINVNKGLYNDAGALKPELSVEGLHLWPNAYIEILKELQPYF